MFILAEDAMIGSEAGLWKLRLCNGQGHGLAMGEGKTCGSAKQGQYESASVHRHILNSTGRASVAE
jgi:hypothetical protein